MFFKVQRKWRSPRARSAKKQDTRCLSRVFVSPQLRLFDALDTFLPCNLASIIQRADTVWSGLNPLMDQRIASTYDQVAAQLHELCDAYTQAGDIDGFQQKLAGFRVRYSNRPAMYKRIEKLRKCGAVDNVTGCCR